MAEYLYAPWGSGDPDESDSEISEETEATEETETDENSELYFEEDSEELMTEETENGEVTADRAEIYEKSPYSAEVNDRIRSVEELEIYQNAGLREEQIDGQTCLVRDDIDWDQKDEFGRTNRERVEEDELVPYAPNGEKIELHHIGQHDDSPLAELTTSEHRGKGNDAILHDKTKESEIDRADFNDNRKEYWKARSGQ